MFSHGNVPKKPGKAQISFPSLRRLRVFDVESRLRFPIEIIEAFLFHEGLSMDFFSLHGPGRTRTCQSRKQDGRRPFRWVRATQGQRETDRHNEATGRSNNFIIDRDRCLYWSLPSCVRRKETQDEKETCHHHHHSLQVIPY